MNFSRMLFGGGGEGGGPRQPPPMPPTTSSSSGSSSSAPLPLPVAGRREQTFSDADFHRTQRIGAGTGGGGGGGYSYHHHTEEGAQDPNKGARSGYENNTFGSRKKSRPDRRWSYMLQDIPVITSAALNDVNKGYVMRVAAVFAATVGIGALLYYSLVVPRQERRPLAQRSYWLCPKVPVTLIEKNREEGTNMYVYRFALPNSYDYAGYRPVSSVRVYSGRVRELSSLARWYTPISEPDERGFIEFAIKDCDPGRMCSRLRYLELGDVVYLGRWMKEFDYSKVSREGGEMGMVATTAGASVAMQIIATMAKEERQRRQQRPDDGEAAAARPTRLQLLYCHQSARAIPFKESVFDRAQAAMPDRFSVKYNVLSMGTAAATITTDSAGKGKRATRDEEMAGGAKPLVYGENCFVGNIDPEMLEVALPPPARFIDAPTNSTSSSGDASQPGAVAAATYRPHILVCGPQSMMTYLCGRVSPLSNYTYSQGWWFRYNGFLKDMGYERAQVYKFGVSTHFLAMH